MGKDPANLAAKLRARAHARRARTLADRLEARREVEEAICDATLEVFDAHEEAEAAANDTWTLEEEIERLQPDAADSAAVQARARARIAELRQEVDAIEEDVAEEDATEEDDAGLVNAIEDEDAKELASAIADVWLAEKYVLVLAAVRARLDGEAAEEAIDLASEYTDRDDLVALLAERRIVATAAPLMRRVYEQAIAPYAKIEVNLADVKTALDELVFPLDD